MDDEIYSFICINFIKRFDDKINDQFYDWFNNCRKSKKYKIQGLSFFHKERKKLKNKIKYAVRVNQLAIKKRK
jgi:hypothetical protein